MHSARKFQLLLLLGVAFPIIIVLISWIQPYYIYPSSLVIGVQTISGTDPRWVFVIDVSNQIRPHLLYGLFAGFSSGVLAAGSFLMLRSRAH